REQVELGGAGRAAQRALEAAPSRVRRVAPAELRIRGGGGLERGDVADVTDVASEPFDELTGVRADIENAVDSEHREEPPQVGGQVVALRFAHDGDAQLAGRTLGELDRGRRP